MSVTVLQEKCDPKEALDKKLAAHNLFTTTKASIISHEEEMNKAIQMMQQMQSPSSPPQGE